MRNGFLFCFFLFTATLSAWAAPDMEAELEKKLPELHQRLGLTAEEAVPVDAVMRKYARQFGNIVQQGRSRSTYRKLKKLRSAQEKELSELLTGEQMDTFKVWREEQRERMRSQMRR